MNNLIDKYFSATLRTKDIDYEAKGFTLNETEDVVELRRHGVLVDRFSFEAPMQAIRNSCKCWLIKNGDFDCLGITTEAQNV